MPLRDFELEIEDTIMQKSMRSIFLSIPTIRGIEWSHPIWKCSQNLAFARIARKN